MKVLIRNKRSEREIVCNENTPILHAALCEGVELPYECLSGSCGSCKGKLTRGRLEKLWPTASGWNLLKNDEYLLCQSRALESSEIEVADGPPILEGKPQFYKGRLFNIQRLNENVLEFSVELDVLMPFSAGQFVALSFEGLEGARCYSMVNSGIPSNRLDFVIKRKLGGEVSTRLFEANCSGQPVSCFGPVGHAVFDPRRNKRLICIAGGSGIAGMMAIVRRAEACGHLDKHDCDVFFGVQRSCDVFYLTELAALVDSSTRLRVTVALSAEDPSDELRNKYPSLNFSRGFVHDVAASAYTRPVRDASAFVAGPPPAVNAALRELLLKLKLPATSIRYDKFS